MVETEPQLKFEVDNSTGKDNLGDLDLNGMVV
jgi:hypothetical protein